MATKRHLPSRTQLLAIARSEDPRRYQARLLLDALDDWPTFGSTEPPQLLQALRDEVGPELTYARLSAYADSPNCPEWESSALVAILEMFRQGATLRGDVNLETLVAQLTEDAS